jgi:ribonuclease HI
MTRTLLHRVLRKRSAEPTPVLTESTVPVQTLLVDASFVQSFGIAGIGVAFKGGRVVCGEVVIAKTAHEAETLALLRAVEIASTYGQIKTRIFSDSTVAVQAANGKAKHPNCGAAAYDLQRRLAAASRVTVEWRSRDYVRSAHILARQTYKAWIAGTQGGVTWSPPNLPNRRIAAEAGGVA